MRYCIACVRRTRLSKCGACGRATITHRRHVEWAVLCHLAELGPDQYQTTVGIWTLAGDGVGRREFGQIMRGLAVQGLTHVEHRWDGPRYYRVPGAMIEYHMGDRR